MMTFDFWERLRFQRLYHSVMRSMAQKPAPRESRGTWRVSDRGIGFRWVRAIEFMAQAWATDAGVAPGYYPG